MTDPFETALRDQGDDPAPGFVAELESMVSGAYRGELVVERPTQPRGAVRNRRAIVSIAAALVATGSLAAVLAWRDPGESSVQLAQTVPSTTPLTMTPTSIESLAPANTASAATTSETGTSTSTSTTQPVATSLATEPTMTTEPLSSTPYTLPGSSLPVYPYPYPYEYDPPPVPVDAKYVLIDMDQELPELELENVVSIPKTENRTASSAVAPDGRLAILDQTDGTIRFFDAVDGHELASYPIALDAPRTSGGLGVGRLWLGPDDVIYTNSFDETDFGGYMRAYAPVGQQYVEVARSAPGPADDWIHMTDTGFPVRMPYVDPNGQVSGKRLGVADFLPADSGTTDFTVCTLWRGGPAWDVKVIGMGDSDDDPDYPPCRFNEHYGPGDSIVVQSTRHTEEQTTSRVALLGDEATVWQTDRTYIGSTDDALYFAGQDADSIDIGRVPI